MAKVVVLPFEQSFACDDGETILAAALRQRYYLRYGCKHGGCGTCKAVLVDGDVDERGSTFALGSAERQDGWILLCSSVPAGECTIDVSSMELSEDDFLSGDKAGFFSAEVISIEPLTADIRAVRLRLVEPASMTFVAGQFVNVEVPGTSEARSYSMANPPSSASTAGGWGDQGHVDLIVKLLPRGLFSSYLEERLLPGETLRFCGPFGELKVRLSHRPMVMVAGGSGLAPLLSMLADLAEKENERPITLFFGARRPEDLYRVEEIRQLQARMPVLGFVPVLSDEWPDDWDGETGLVTEALARTMPDLSGWDAYLCGPPPMIDAGIDLLVERGVKPRNIYFDAFVSTGG